MRAIQHDAMDGGLDQQAGFHHPQSMTLSTRSGRQLSDSRSISSGVSAVRRRATPTSDSLKLFGFMYLPADRLDELVGMLVAGGLDPEPIQQADATFDLRVPGEAVSPEGPAAAVLQIKPRLGFPGPWSGSRTTDHDHQAHILVVVDATKLLKCSRWMLPWPTK